jgi:hypothetical protein
VTLQMQNLAPSVAEDHARVEQPESGGDGHKHVDGSDTVDLVVHKGFARLVRPVLAGGSCISHRLLV